MRWERPRRPRRRAAAGERHRCPQRDGRRGEGDGRFRAGAIRQHKLNTSNSFNTKEVLGGGGGGLQRAGWSRMASFTSGAFLSENHHEGFSESALDLTPQELHRHPWFLLRPEPQPRLVNKYDGEQSRGGKSPVGGDFPAEGCSKELRKHRVKLEPFPKVVVKIKLFGSGTQSQNSLIRNKQ